LALLFARVGKKIEPIGLEGVLRRLYRIFKAESSGFLMLHPTAISPLLLSGALRLQVP
jgi:hypothetical protein